MTPQVRPNLPGLATHWQPGETARAACGTPVTPRRLTTDRKGVNCLKCRASRKWIFRDVIDRLGREAQDKGSP